MRPYLFVQGLRVTIPHDMSHEDELEDFRRRLGIAGENCLRTLAEKFNVTHPEKDLGGWDFLIEEVTTKRTLFGPRSAGKLKAWVQVKAVAEVANRKSVPRVQVKLSNWKRALESDPWFFLVVEVNEQFRPQHVWLVHVSDTWIERVARRIAEGEDTTSSADDPKLELTWGTEDELPVTDAEAFAARIRGSIGEDLDSYRLAKRLKRDKAGFERFDVSGTVELPAEDSEVQLIRHFLGYQKLSAEARYLRERRWDKDRVKHALGAGTLPTSWEPITVSLSGACRPMTLSGRLYRTEQIQKLTMDERTLAFPDHVIASRLDSPPLDIVHLMETWHLRLSAVDSCGLVNLHRAAIAFDIHRAISKVHNAQGFLPIRVEPRMLEKVNLDLDGDPDLASLVAEVGREQEKIRHLSLALGLTDNTKDERVKGFGLKARFPEWKYHIEPDERHVWYMARIVHESLLTAGVDGVDTLSCHYDDLLRQNNQIFALGILTNCTGRDGIVFRFTLKTPLPPWKEMRVPVVIPMTIGDYRILATGFLWGELSHEPEIDPAAYCLRCDRGELAYLRIAPASQLNQPEIDQASERLGLGRPSSTDSSSDTEDAWKLACELGRIVVKREFTLASGSRTDTASRGGMDSNDTAEANEQATADNSGSEPVEQ